MFLMIHLALISFKIKLLWQSNVEQLSWIWPKRFLKTSLKGRCKGRFPFYRNVSENGVIIKAVLLHSCRTDKYMHTCTWVIPFRNPFLWEVAMKKSVTCLTGIYSGWILYLVDEVHFRVILSLNCKTPYSWNSG